MRRWTFDLDIELTHGQPAYVLGKASEYRRRPRSFPVDPLSRRGEVAHGVLCSSPKPEQTILFRLGAARREEGSRFFRRLFSAHQPTTHLRSRYRINPRSTRFVSGKASEYRWRPNFMWIHGLGGERLLVMSYALYPMSEMDRDFLSSAFYTPAVKCFFSDAWQAPAIYYRRSCELCDRRVGRSP